jgi:signal transduction histidine kinase
MLATVKGEESLFRIDDTGPGFNESDIPYLFKKFYKGDRTRSMERGHSGLGMYIAKTIVEKHGGTMKAYNRPEGGARVEFSIKYFSAKAHDGLIAASSADEPNEYPVTPG